MVARPSFLRARGTNILALKVAKTFLSPMVRSNSADVLSRLTIAIERNTTSTAISMLSSI